MYYSSTQETEDEEFIELSILECKMVIIDEFIKYKKCINICKKEYPKIYKMLEPFFNELKCTKNREGLLVKYLKEFEIIDNNNDLALPNDAEHTLLNFDKFLDEDEYYEKQQPYVKSEPKVGRNDKCPCGSGKKYKHCCGR